MRVLWPARLTTIYGLSLIAFLCGLGLSRIEQVDGAWAIVGICVFFLGLLSRRRPLLCLCAITCMLLLGWWRGSVVFHATEAYDELIGRTIVIEATATTDAVYGKHGQLEFEAGSMYLVQPHGQPLVGEIDIAGRSTMVRRGDRVRMVGKLFRKRGGQIVGTSFASITVIRTGASPIERFRRNFAAGLQDTLPEPMASFALGLLIGQRTTLDKDLQDDLVTVGLIHIVAVSGYNLTVIIVMVRRLFRRRSRFQSLVFSQLLIMSFLLITGFSPSIVRAAIVSSLSLIAWYYGRVFKPLVLLLFVAALTAGWNPLYLWSNIGWYLSFTAFFGVLILGPLLSERYIPHYLREAVLPAVLCETIAAQVCTLPIILFTFGRLSLISIVANVLVVPLTPLAMLLSLLSGLGGMINFLFSGVVVWPTKLVLTYMLHMASLLARLPYASIEVPINTPSMIVGHGLILVWVWLLRVQIKRKSAIITGIEESQSYVRTQQMVNN